MHISVPNLTILASLMNVYAISTNWRFRLSRVLIFLFFFSPVVVMAAGKKGDRFIGTSAFTLVNINRDENEPVDFYQLNLGYYLTDKDVLSIEVITWKYYHPLGYGIFPSDDQKYPGSVKGLGPGLAYQRFLWGQMYVALHATWLKQEYSTPANVKIGTGEQLFVAYRAGYHFQIGNTFFLQPSVAVTSWPINTGLPPSFQQKEDGASKFTVEPGLHLGFLF